MYKSLYKTLKVDCRKELCKEETVYVYMDDKDRLICNGCDNMDGSEACLKCRKSVLDLLE